MNRLDISRGPGGVVKEVAAEFPARCSSRSCDLLLRTEYSGPGAVGIPRAGVAFKIRQPPGGGGPRRDSNRS